MTKLPILQCGAFVVSELEPIINLVEKKGHSLTEAMDADEKNDLRAYLSLTEKIFTNAEVIIGYGEYERLNAEHVSLTKQISLTILNKLAVYLLDGQANIGRSDL